jgi:hypothetical protein
VDTGQATLESMQETHDTAGDASPATATDRRGHPARTVAAAAALTGLAAASAAALAPVLAGISLNHNETLVRRRHTGR